MLKNNNWPNRIDICHLYSNGNIICNLDICRDVIMNLITHLKESWCIKQNTQIPLEWEIPVLNNKKFIRNKWFANRIELLLSSQDCYFKKKKISDLKTLKN